MYKNVCIILLIFLVYLIYKISRNECDCFSVGGQDSCYFDNMTCKIGTFAQKSSPDPCSIVNADDCNKSWWQSEIDGGSNGKTPIGVACKYVKGECVTPGTGFHSISGCPAESCKIKLEPKDKNPSQFLARINEAFNDNNSNGVFVSMIDDITGLMDGSGSVLNKNTYIMAYGQYCSLGFIWDTDWLDKNLVDCLFPMNAMTSYFDSSNCNSPNYPNYCEFAHTSGSNTPDRCSQGLSYYFKNNYMKGNNLPNPTNCEQNKIYDYETMKRLEFQNKENCFTYINDKYKNILKYTHLAPVWNEGVFIKDVGYNFLDYHTGFKKLIELNKPLPAALLILLYNVDFTMCINNKNYKNILKRLKSNFTSDTIVVIANCYDRDSITSFDDVPTTLGEMPGYDKV